MIHRIMMALLAVLWVGTAEAQLPNPSINVTQGPSANPVTATGVTSSFANPQYQGPIDIINAQGGGVSVAAAHSFVRRLLASYNGTIGKIESSAAGNPVTAIGTTSTGIYNAATVATALTGYYGYVAEVCDQVSGHCGGTLSAPACNDLPQPTLTSMAPWYLHPTTLLPVVVVGVGGGAYNNRPSEGGTTCNIPTGAAAATLYAVISTSDLYSAADGVYGRMEISHTSITGGSMQAVSWGNYNVTNPAVMIDQEGAVNPNPIPSTPVALVISKYIPSTGVYQTKVYNAETGALLSNKSNVPWVIPPVVQAGLGLGNGGDETGGPISFFEGAIINGDTSDATDSALAANVAAFYGAMQTAVSAGPADVVLVSACAGALCTNNPSRVISPFVGAYGFDRMRAGYTGYAVHLLNVGTSATTDVGFNSSGLFDNTTALNVCTAAVISGHIDNGSGSAGTTLTVSSVASGALGTGMVVIDGGSEILPGTLITAGSGSSWTVTQSQKYPTIGSNANIVATNCVGYWYNQALSQSAAAHRFGTGIDPDGSLYDVSATASSVWPYFAPNAVAGKPAFLFNAAQAVCTTSTPNSGEGLGNNAIANNEIYYLVADRLGGTGVESAGVGMNGTHGQVGIEYPASANTVQIRTASGGGATLTTATASDNAFHNIIAQINAVGGTSPNGDTSISVDGATPTTNAGNATWSFGSGWFSIGNLNYGTNCGSNFDRFNGLISEAMVGSMPTGNTGAVVNTGFLTATQMNAIYQNPHTRYGAAF